MTGTVFSNKTKEQQGGHNFNLSKGFSRLDLRQFNFSQTVVNYWNRLPRHVLGYKSVNDFKAGLDETLFGGLFSQNWLTLRLKSSQFIAP